MECRFTVTLSPADLAAAQALVMRQHPVRRLAPLVISLAGIAFGGLLALAVSHFQPEQPPRYLLSVFAKGMALTMLFLGAQYIMLLGLVGRVARTALTEPRRIEVRLSGTTLELETDGRQSTHAMRDLRRTVEDGQFLILVFGTANFYALPKSQLDEAALMALKRALATARTKPAP